MILNLNLTTKIFLILRSLVKRHPAEQYFQLCDNLMELDKSSKQAGRSEASRKAGRHSCSNTVIAGSNSSNTAGAAGSNSSTNAVADNFRFININYNFHPFPYSAALV